MRRELWVSRTGYAEGAKGDTERCWHFATKTKSFCHWLSSLVRKPHMSNTYSTNNHSFQSESSRCTEYFIGFPLSFNVLYKLYKIEVIFFISFKSFFFLHCFLIKCCSMFSLAKWKVHKELVPAVTSAVALCNRTFCNDETILYLCCPIWKPLAIYWVLEIWLGKWELNF